MFDRSGGQQSTKPKGLSTSAKPNSFELLRRIGDGRQRYRDETTLVRDSYQNHIQ